MALIKCAECGKEVSENAMACPNCGNPMMQRVLQTKASESRKSIVRKIVWGIGFAIVAFIFYIILVVVPSHQMTPEKAQKILKESEQSFKEKMENDEKEARKYIRIIQSDYASLKQKREAYNELIKKNKSFSEFTIEEIENMK